MTTYHDILRQYWGYEDFRELQLEIIESVAQGRDTLGLMPTGGGKSLTFQVPALAMEGICLVITPLIALMRDQVERLKSMDIRAACLHSGMTQQEIQIVLDNCLYGDFKFLYVSPERLGSDIFLQKALNLPVNLLVVDEAHCISQWGYDFRPSYLNIAHVREYFPSVPVLALTATATPEVVDDIQEKLHFATPNVFKVSFERKNLAYVVRETQDKEKALFQILKGVAGTSIVYVRNRAKTKQIAAFLKAEGIEAAHFHAGLDNQTKQERQAAWKNGSCRVIVSTNAFGMGIDKPDVRSVIHMDLPDSLEAYFQEAGRAGRDGKKAYAVLLYHKSDTSLLKKRLSDNFPEKKYILKVYDALGNYYQLAVGSGQGMSFPFNLQDFCSKFRLNMLQAHNALKILELASYLELTDEQDSVSRVYFLNNREDLYHLPNADNKTDRILQVLLRSYTGLFSDFVRIQEEVLASRLQMTREEVYEGLLFLSRQGVIHYIPRKKTPFVFYTQAREEIARLRIGPEVYEERKNRYLERIIAMQAYAAENQLCRSKRLLHYFGQNRVSNCKQCDVCLKKQQEGLRQYEFEDISKDMLKALDNNHPDLEELIDSLPYEKQKSLKVFRFLCDRGDIIQQEHKLYLKTE
ncbi:MAG: ATP-dependent DNA helicase RecQ [Bacteroidales bacterium]